jgi:magnesium transporter
MLTKHTHKDLVWIDLNKPTHTEVESLITEFNLHPIVAESLLEPTLHPKVEEYKDMLYLVMHFPTMNRSRFGSDQQEIDFVIGKNFLITAHYENSDQLRNFAKQFEVNTIVESNPMGEHPGFLFYYIIKNLYNDMRLELQSLRSHTKSIEDVIFSGNNGKIVEDLSEISHKILDFREATRFHKSILISFETASEKLFGSSFGSYADTLTNEYYKLWEILENLRETIIELKKTNDSLLAFKTNETIRFLTLFTFIVLPLQIIPDIFTTNVFVEGRYSSEMIHILTLGVSALLFLYLRFRKWI